VNRHVQQGSGKALGWCLFPSIVRTRRCANMRCGISDSAPPAVDSREDGI
jgi:hypothetical protein